MNKFNKVLALCLALVFCLALSACGGQTETTEAPDTADNTDATVTEAPDYSGEDGDTYAQMDYMTEDLSKYITLGGYKGIEISIPRYIVTDEDVAEEVQAIIDGLTTYEPYEEHVTDRVTEGGDFVNIDYVGTIDGEPFEGGSNEGDSIVLAENNGFLDWFEDDLYGVMPGTTVVTTGFFPENYHEHLAGKEVTFTIKVNYIAGHYTIPVFDDELVFTYTGVATADEYKEIIRASLQAESDDAHTVSKYQTMWGNILDAATVVELPKSQVMYYYTSQRSMYEAYAQQYGLTYDELLTQLGGTDAELMTYMEERVKEELVFYSVVKAEGLDVSDEEYAVGLAQYALDQGVTEEELETEYGVDYIRECVLWDKTMVYLGTLTNFAE